MLRDVERGTWTAPDAVEPPAEAEPVPTFCQFAELWWMRNEAQLRPSTRVDYDKTLRLGGLFLDAPGRI